MWFHWLAEIAQIHDGEKAQLHMCIEKLQAALQCRRHVLMMLFHTIPRWQQALRKHACAYQAYCKCVLDDHWEAHGPSQLQSMLRYDKRFCCTKEDHKQVLCGSTNCGRRYLSAWVVTRVGFSSTCQNPVHFHPQFNPHTQSNNKKHPCWTKQDGNCHNIRSQQQPKCPSLPELPESTNSGCKYLCEHHQEWASQAQESPHQETVTTHQISETTSPAKPPRPTLTISSHRLMARLYCS